MRQAGLEEELSVGAVGDGDPVDHHLNPSVDDRMSMRVGSRADEDLFILLVPMVHGSPHEHVVVEAFGNPGVVGRRRPPLMSRRL